MDNSIAQEKLGKVETQTLMHELHSIFVNVSLNTNIQFLFRVSTQLEKCHFFGEKCLLSEIMNTKKNHSYYH